MLASVLGIAAAAWAVAMALAPLLQVREIVRRRSAAGLSLAYPLVLIVGFALWVGYGMASSDLPLVIPNTLAFCVMAVFVAVIARFR
jgi:MtN3 and saliva related transmembrane protein